MLKTFLPNSPLLQKYIELFYVFNNAKPQQFSYVAFPHTNTAISLFKAITISRQHFEVRLEPNSNSQHTCVEILGKYTQPVFVHYNGDFEEIAIVFKPYGVNYFIAEDFATVAPSYSQQFNDQVWISFSNELFNADDDDRLALLEQFLLNHLKEKANNYVTEVLRYLEDTNEDYSIEWIASQINVNIKTLQRNFLKQMGCTAQEYKRIARFRNALKTKILSSEVKSLTNISYESNYYDQSYFIREFKKLTNLNPKKFFDAITVLDEQKIIWEIK